MDDADTNRKFAESLDLDGLRRLVDMYCDSKIGPLIVGGSTGELFSLTMDERKKIVEVAVEQSAGRLPIIAGCPHSGTQKIWPPARRSVFP